MTWSANDEGYLRAYKWAGALAGGAQLPVLAAPFPLGPGEVAHAQIGPVKVIGFYGEKKGYRRGFLMFGGPVGLAVTGAASYARNQSKKAEAERAAAPHWHDMGIASIVVTNQRLMLSVGQNTEGLWHAESGPMQLLSGPGGVPVIQFQPAGMPELRLESPWSAMLYVFVHHLLEGRPPGVPMPPGVLERAPTERPIA